MRDLIDQRDRLLILLIAATFVVAIPVGYASGLVEARAGGLTEPVLLVALGLLLLVILVGVWFTFVRIDE